MIHPAPDCDMHSRPMSWRLSLLLLSAAVSCRRPAQAESDSVTVLQVSPEPIVVREGHPNTVTIRGARFDATANTVTVGPVTLATISSRSSGTVITLTLPGRVPSGGGAAPMLWSAGRYPLTVSNTRGTSVPVMVTVQEPR